MSSYTVRARSRGAGGWGLGAGEGGRTAQQRWAGLGFSAVCRPISGVSEGLGLVVPMLLGGADERTGWCGSGAAQNSESKKEEFRKYLERAGVIDALTKGRQLPRAARPRPRQRPRHQLVGQRALLRALAGWRAALSGRSDVLGVCSAGGALRDQ